MQKIAPHELLHEIEHFYYREARLFGNKHYREWLESMVDKGVHYWLPIFEERLRADRKPAPQFPPFVYDDIYTDLDERIKRLETNLVWMEDPPTRIRHLVTNIEAYCTQDADEFESYSNFLVCRNRREREETILVGGREDLLARRGSDLRLLRRKIIISQRVVMDTNLYFFM